MRMKRAKAMIPPTTTGPRLWTAEAVAEHAREVAGLPPDAALIPPARAPETGPSLTERLFARDAQAAEAQRHAPVRAYRAELDNRVAALLGRPVGILAALEEERRNIVACAAKIRPALLAIRDKYSAPPPTARKIVADQVRALQQQAQGALDMLDNHPALLGQWIERVANPPDNASPNLAEAHWTSIWPLLDRARGLPGLPKDLAAAVQAIEDLSARLLHEGPAVELPRGSGPLPATLDTPRASRSYRATTEVDHS